MHSVTPAPPKGAVEVSSQQVEWGDSVVWCAALVLLAAPVPALRPSCSKYTARVKLPRSPQAIVLL